EPDVDPRVDDLEDPPPIPTRSSSMADADWYKAMMQRRFERSKQDRLDHARRRQREEEEREVQQCQAAHPHTEPPPQNSPSPNPPPQTTNNEQQTPQIKPTESTSTEFQSPFAASEPTIPPPSPQNIFDETNPPTSPIIDNSLPAPYTNLSLESTNT